MIAFVGGASGAGNTGTMFISLKPYDAAQGTADQIVARLRPKLSHFPGVSLFLQSVQDLRMGGRVAHPVPVRAGGRRPGRAAGLEPQGAGQAEVAARSCAT